MARSCSGLGGSSRRYHCPKLGNRSHYPERLAKRDLAKAPTLPSLDSLRRRQSTDEWLCMHPAIRDQLEALRAAGAGDDG